MANTRAQLKTKIAEAIRTRPAEQPWLVATQTARSSGLCRAVWACLSVDQRNALVRQAEREARRLVEREQPL